MSIDQLDLILYDMSHMDVCMPPLFGDWRDYFKKASYSQWAIKELRVFIAKRLYPHTNGTINEFIKLTKEFMMRLDRYSKINTETELIFNSARDAIDNVLDLLTALK